MSYLTNYGQISGGLAEGSWLRTIEGFYGCRYPSVFGDASSFTEESLRAMGFRRLSEQRSWPTISTRLIADLRDDSVVRLRRTGETDAGASPLLEARFTDRHPTRWMEAVRREGGLAFILGMGSDVTDPIPDGTDEFTKRADRIWFVEAPARLV